MGLSGGKGSKTYVSIVGGEFTIRVPEGTEGAYMRVLTKGKNAGKTIHELKYSKLSGYIKGIDYSNKTFGDYIEIIVHDDKEYILQISWNDYSCRDGFIKRLHGIDKNKEVVFSVFKDKEKDRTVFIVGQEGEWIKSKYTRSKPDGIPEPKEKNIRGSIETDYSEVENFLYDVLTKEMERFNDGRVYPDQEELNDEYGSMSREEAEKILSDNPQF